MKKFLTFFAAVLMASSMMAETIYCKMEHSWWKADGAAVGVYAYGAGAPNATWPGERMTPVEGEKDLWSYDLVNPEAYTAIIFVRVNGNGDIADWGAKTADLSLEAKGENNLYTITSSTAVWGNPGCTGTWSVYSAEPGPGPEPEPEATIDTLYLVNSKGWGTPKIYFYGGKVGQLTAWPGDNMTKVDGVKADGFDVYMFAINHGDQANVIFNNGGSVQSGDLVIAGNEGKYFNFADQTWYESAEAVVCTWYLNANYNGTTEWRELTRGEGFTRRDVYAPATNYYYNGMADDNLRSEIKGAKLTIDSNLAEGDSAVFTLDPYAKTINITKIVSEGPGPETVITKDTAYYYAGTTTEWVLTAMPYAVTLPKDSTIAFKQVLVVTTTTKVGEDEPTIKNDTTWYGQAGEEGVMTRESNAWALDGEYDVLLTTDAEGEYTFSLVAGVFTVTFPEIEEPKAPEYGIMINGETFVAAVKNEDYVGDGEEWVVNVAFEGGERFHIYNKTEDAGWVIAQSTFSEKVFTVTEEDDNYVVADAGDYVLYIKLIYGADEMYVGYTPAKTEPDPEATKDTVYYVNWLNWEKVYVHAWEGTATGTTWPGLEATKMEEQIKGYDVYMFEAETGAYGKCIFNNGNGTQSADLDWTAGKYYYNNQWLTLEELAEAGDPTEPQKADITIRVLSRTAPLIWWWSGDIDPSNKTYTWETRPAMPREGETDWYSMTFENVNVDMGLKYILTIDGVDSTMTATESVCLNSSYEAIDCDAELEPLVEAWTVVGVSAIFSQEWTPAAEAYDMTKQEDGSWVLVLTDIDLFAGDFYYKAVKDHSWDVSVPGYGMGNNMLTVAEDGVYTITFTLSADEETLTAAAEKTGESTVTYQTTSYLAANFTDWAANMQELPYSVSLPADSTLAFKLVKVVATLKDEVEVSRDTIWCGQVTENFYMTRENIGAGWTLDGDKNVMLTTDKEGLYTFSLEGETFIVSFPELANKSLTFYPGAAAEANASFFLMTSTTNGDPASDVLPMTKEENGTWTAEVKENVSHVYVVRCMPGAEEVVWEGVGQTVWNGSGYYEYAPTYYFDGWNADYSWFFDLTTENPNPIPSAVENGSISTVAIKAIQNGNLYIIREGKTYNATGSLVK